MNQETMLKPALIAGIIVGVLSALPVLGALNCLCCAWVIGGGILAAYLSVKASPWALTLGRGMALGLLAGAIAAIVDTAFSIPIHFALSGMGMGVAEQINEALEQVPNMPEDLRQALRSVFIDGDEIGIFFLVLTGVFKVLVYSIVAALGGAIGVAIFEKRPPGSQAAPATPAYQPPLQAPPPPPPPPDSSEPLP